MNFRFTQYFSLPFHSQNGVRTYAQAVIESIDPNHQLFGSRVIARDDVPDNSETNFFNNFLPAEGKGAFRTGKQDAREHGFGLKSVRMSVESYKGEMKVYAKNNVFNVNILLPVPAQTDGTQI